MEGDERFKNMTIKNIMKDSFKYSDTRLSADAVELTSEYLRIIATEALFRASKVASDQGDNEVRLEHFQQCVMALLLDF